MFCGQFWMITTKQIKYENDAAKSECVCCCSPLPHTPWGAVEPPCFQKDWPHMQGCQEWPLAMPSQPPPPSYCPENKTDRGRPYWQHVTDALIKQKILSKSELYQDSVKGWRCSSSLHMTKNSGTCVKAELLSDQLNKHKQMWRICHVML